MESRREDIMRAAMAGVRVYGLDGVRVQQIGRLAGTAAGNIYAYFDSKEELLRACFERVDRQVARLFDQVRVDQLRLAVAPEEEIRRVWTPYFRWLVAHPDETVFYFHYRASAAFPAYERVRDISYFQSFVEIMRQFEAHYKIYEQVDADILWLHLLNGTVLYAKYVVEGVLPNDQATEESLFRLASCGLQGLLRPVEKTACAAG